MYVKDAGLEGFFEIWTRREAFGKYTGEGFFGEFRDFTDEKGEPVSSLDTVVFREIEVGSDIKCICCVSKNTGRPCRDKSARGFLDEWELYGNEGDIDVKRNL